MTDQDTQSYSTLAYLRRLADETRPALAFAATNRAEWQAWHEALVHRLSVLAGSLPSERGDLNPRVVERVPCEGYVREKVVFESEPGVAVPAYLLVPDGVREDGAARAVLCLHGHGRGKADVVGVAGGDVERQVRIR